MNSDRIDGIYELIAPCLENPTSVHPWVVAAAADFASYADIFRFDFTSAIRRQEWAEPYHRETRGPFASIYGQCLCGIAANERLDVASAEKYFRTALRRARRNGGIHTHGGVSPLPCSESCSTNRDGPPRPKHCSTRATCSE